MPENQSGASKATSTGSKNAIFLSPIRNKGALAYSSMSPNHGATVANDHEEPPHNRHEYFQAVSDTDEERDLLIQHEKGKVLPLSPSIKVFPLQYWFVIVTCAVTFLIVLVDVAISYSHKNSGDATVSLSVFNLTLEVRHPSYDTLDSLNYLQWEHIAEPYKPMKYSVKALATEAEGDISVDGVDVTWIIDDTKYEGSTVEATINGSSGTRQGSVEVVYYSSSGTRYSCKNEFDITLKYVRRNLYSLNDDDLASWLSALKIYYSTPTAKGQQIYGDKYFSAETSLYDHLNAAGRSDCDHWHDGAGILVNHAAFTLAVEQSLQAIDPTLSMPYWEYAQDTSLYDEWWMSKIFSDDIFGANANMDSDTHTVTTGVFANLQMPSGEPYEDFDIAAEGSLNPFVNAYGLLRSPWNNNPSSTLSRHNMTYDRSITLPFPTCSVMYSCYVRDSLSGMNDCLNGETHGPVHIHIGGAWGETSDIWNSNINFIAGTDKLFYFKMLWRAGYTRCPTSCNEPKDADAGVCMCAVPDEYFDTYTAIDMLNNTGIYDIVSSRMNGNEAMALKLLRAVEDPGIVGEMFSSASSYDPLFWPLHGQLERLMGLKRLNVELGLVDFDETWGFQTSEKSYLNGICDWSKVQSSSDLTLPTCTLGDEYVCPGHNADDIVFYSDFLNNGESYTNQEFYDFMHPNNADLPYVYDSYDFDYCPGIFQV